LGILALAVAFQMGAQTVQGQTPGLIVAATPLGSTNGGVSIVLENGDIWTFDITSRDGTYWGNVFADGPVTRQETTWGRVEAERR
jgi:hypothetical protein